MNQIRQFGDSVTAFRWTNPIPIDRPGGVIARHGRNEAATLLGIEEVPTICLEDMTEDETRAHVIADNELADNAGWDREVLMIELQGLIELGADLDLTLRGFQMREIDNLIDEPEIARDGERADEMPVVDDGPAVTRLGDIWCIGGLRPIHGGWRIRGSR